MRRRLYISHDEARQDTFDQFEMFHSPKRRHSFSNNMSPVEYEKQYCQRLGGVWKSRGDSILL